MLDKTDGREDFYKLMERFNRKFIKVAPECGLLDTYKFWEYIRTANVKVEFEEDTPYVIYVDPDATLVSRYEILKWEIVFRRIILIQKLALETVLNRLTS